MSTAAQQPASSLAKHNLPLRLRLLFSAQESAATLQKVAASKAPRELRQAACDGEHALGQSCTKYVNYLREDGHLLYAWHGTRAIEAAA